MESPNPKNPRKSHTTGPKPHQLKTLTTKAQSKTAKPQPPNHHKWAKVRTKSIKNNFGKKHPILNVMVGQNWLCCREHFTQPDDGFSSIFTVDKSLYLYHWRCNDDFRKYLLENPDMKTVKTQYKTKVDWPDPISNICLARNIILAFWLF